MSATKRGRGRPKLAAEDRREHTAKVPLTADELASWKRWADLDGARSVADWIRDLAGRRGKRIETRSNADG